MYFRCLPVVAILLAQTALWSPGLAQSAGDATTKKAGAGRVGTLSPDEQRRADRARRRATSTAKQEPARAAETEHHDKSKLQQKIVTLSPRISSVTRRGTAREQLKEKQERKTASSTSSRRQRAGMLPARRAFARAPRVGDVIPYGVRLNPVPPGYEPAPRSEVARESPGAPLRYYPPFPRSRYYDYDDYGPE